jgi:hypothetical protein
MSDQTNQDDKINSLLTGLIIFLVLMVVWKCNTNNNYPSSGLKLSCGCHGDKCRCKGYSWKSKKNKHTGCSGGSRREPMNDGGTPSLAERERIASSSGSIAAEQGYSEGDNYSDEVVKNMGLEVGVGVSHKRYCDSLAFSGMPTGASSCTELEETGRSINTSNFVGLTARKFCRSRALAVPGSTARTTSSKDIIEHCNIGEDCLI